MSLRLNGKYIKIIAVNTSHDIEFLVFKAAEQRARWPENIGEFETFTRDSLYAPQLAETLAVQADRTKTIIDNLLTAAYAAMKQDTKFKDATDD